MTKPLPPPTVFERDQARVAAAALRAAIADPSTMGEHMVMHLDLSRPRDVAVAKHRQRSGEWREMWANLPGFLRINRTRYRHALLPGWEYARDEIVPELIPDLEAIAERGERPSQATSAAVVVEAAE